MNYQIEKPMTLFQKLEILADAAKYDVACTSSGVDRRNDGQCGWTLYFAFENPDDQRMHL